MEIIKLNLIPSGNNPVCHCSQYDNGRIIRAELFDGLTPYSIASGDSLTLNVRKPDNTIVSANLTTTQGNTYVDFATTVQICAVVGKSLAEIKITNGTTVIGTLNFIIEVERDVLADGIPSESVIEDLEELIAEAIGDDYYNKTEIDAALALKADSADVGEAIDELDIKKVDYADLPKVSDNEPYLFRKTANGKRVGTRLFDTLVGGTVAFNQLQKNTVSGTSYGVTFAYNQGTLNVSTAEGGATGNAFWLGSNDSKWDFVKDHIYYISIGNPSYTYSSGDKVRWYTPTSPTVNFSKSENIYKYTSTSNSYLQLRVDSGAEISQTYKPQVFDLTQMLGSTIADYIYSLEQATAGAGVAFFRRLFPKDYYAYNAGELMSVKTSAHKTRGFNQFDEQIRAGYYSSTTGDFVSYSNSLANQNPIKVEPNTTYYGKSQNYTLNVYFYDSNLRYLGLSNGTNRTFITPEDCHYINICNAYGEGSTYSNDICINISDTAKNGTYEPYIEHTYALDDDLELRGIPKLDANNQLYYDGDTYESSGKVTRLFGLVNLGSLTWTYDSSNTRMVSNIVSNMQETRTARTQLFLCSKYQVISDGRSIGQVPDQSIYSSYYDSGGGGTNLYVHDSNYTDGNIFKNAVNGVYVLVPLQNSTTETADAYKDPQICDDSGSEEYIDTRAVSIPVGHITEYTVDLDTSLLPNTPTANGTYTLKLTIADGIPTYSWIQDI